MNGTDIVRMSEQALKNVIDDVSFIEKEVRRLEKPGLDDVFDEIKQVCRCLLYFTYSCLTLTVGLIHPYSMD